MNFKNLAKRIFADLLIKPVHYSSRAYEKWTRQRLGLSNHYYLMNVFRFFAKKYLIDFSYPNPLEGEKKLRWRVDLCQNTQGWLYRSKRHYEFPWIRAVAEALEEADCFLDVGAHVGVFALTVGQAFPRKKVIALEALSSNYELLQWNVRQNGLSNVIPLHGAVSSQKGKVRFHINPINDGGGSLAPFSEYKTGGIALLASEYQKKHAPFSPDEEVESFRLDDLIDSKSVVKLDVEGTELDALQSGRRAFENGRVDLAVVEVIEETADPVLEWLTQRGFDSFPMGGRAPVQTGKALGPWLGSMGRILTCIRRGSKVYGKIKLP